MLCPDRHDLNGKKINTTLFGHDDSQKNRRLDVNYYPCDQVQLTKENRKSKDSNCIVDIKSPSAQRKKKKELDKYLGTSANFVFILND